jgi:AsmA protein
MKKLLKILGVIVGVFILFFIAAIIAATYFIDAKDYQQKIETAVKEKTGRELIIKGDMSLSFFPWIGMTMGETTLGNAPGFGDQPFASFEQVDLKIKLLPLFMSSVEMRTIILEGMRLNLIKNKQGVTNWQDLQQHSEKTASKDEEKVQGQGLKSLRIGGVKINDAQLSWRDEQSDSAFTVSNFQLQTGEIDPQQPVDMNLDFDFKDTKAGQSWHFGMEGRLAADMDADKASLSDLQIEMANIKLKGDVQITQLTKAPQISAKLSTNEFSPRDTFKQLAITPPETSDQKVLSNVSLSMLLNATSENLDLSQLQIKLDETTAKGNISIRNFNKPAINAKLDIDQINIDRYMPVAADSKPPESSAGKSDEIVLPKELLRSLNIKANVGIAKLTAMQLQSSDVKITLNANKGVMRVYPATAKLYQGGYSGDIKLDVSGDVLRVSMNEKLTGIDVSPLFKDLMDKDWIGGRGDMNAKLSTTGKTMTALRSNLAGNLAFSFLDGAIKGVNISHKIRQANALLTGQPAPPSEPNETRFASLTATGTVNQGVVDNRDMKMDTPLAAITGEGQIDLGKESMDYLIKATVTDQLAKMDSERMKKLAGKTVPVRIKGPFSKLDYKVELSDAIKEQVKEKAKEKIKEKIDDKLKDKLDDKLKNIFKR